MSNAIKVCSFAGCSRKVIARALCGGHYGQWQRGEEVRTLQSDVTPQDRFEKHVDRSGECHLWTGYKNPLGYGRFGIAGDLFYVHRLAYEWAHGSVLPSVEIDHMCHNPACVRVSHLRPTTRKQNNENRMGANAGNRSGYRGVSWTKGNGKWRALVNCKSGPVHLGYFTDRHEAGAAALAKRLEMFTHSDGR